MADKEFARLRPRDLAVVWGTAFGQVLDLWRAALTAFMEVGSAEQKGLTGSQFQVIEVPAVNGHMPPLVAGGLVGETWHEALDGGLVEFEEKAVLGNGRVRVECSVDERSGQPITGDIYRGTVYRAAAGGARGEALAELALDAGS
jgi:hypothetical protein